MKAQLEDWLKKGMTMGEYADDYFRHEVRINHGFDPGSMYLDETPKKPKKSCPKCGKHLKTDQGVLNHLRDYHGLTPSALAQMDAACGVSPGAEC